MGAAVALAILFGVVLVAANQAGWLTAVVLDTDAFVAALAPLPKDEAVSQALAQQTADAMIESFEVTESIADALPEGIEFIAIPLTTGVRDITAEVAGEIIRSDAFSTVWTFALTGAHRIATAYVGALEDGIVVAEDGVAILDLTEFGAQIDEALADRGFDLIADSDRDLKVELFELPDSGAVKFIVDLMYSIRWIVLVLTLALGVGAFVVATDRRRIAKWIGGATIAAMLFSLIELRYARSLLTRGIENQVQKDGAVAAWDILFNRLVAQSWILLLVGVLTVFVAWAAGDSAGARSLKASVVESGDSLRDADEPSSFALFIAAHGRLIEWLTGVVIVGLLLIGPPLAVGWVLVAVVALIVVLAGVEYVRATVPADEPLSETVSQQSPANPGF